MSNKNIELLNKETIFSAIEPKNINRLEEMEIFDSIDSTNSYLLTQVKQNVLSGTVCLAEHQTAGRGRQGKQWVSSRGANLQGSLLWRFTQKRQISSLSIAVGVMIAETLRKYGIISGISLKWPNDILFDGRKLVGILLESNEPGVVVIGIGLNLVSPVDKENFTSNAVSSNLTSECQALDGARERLRGMGDEVENFHCAAVEEILPIRRNYFIGLLLNELLEKIPIYEKSGLDYFFSKWEKYDALKNQTVRLVSSHETVTGVVQGIDREGQLVVNENGRLRSFSYGEVTVVLNPPHCMGNQSC